ncbi:MAG: DUF3850 domain-containing protein [Ruminococcaceae bacterium]|nr:DUF3850 domain-containing protein [Oscillospiraceae bacterium]
MIHRLKILPEYFLAIAKGIKTFDVRFNDRGYKLGDYIVFEEYCEGKYTGRFLVAKIVHILNDPEYCKEGYVILGIK